jgi:hypothetical protein
MSQFGSHQMASQVSVNQRCTEAYDEVWPTSMGSEHGPEIALNLQDSVAFDSSRVIISESREFDSATDRHKFN